MTRSEAKDDKGEPGALAELVGHDPTMADALTTLTKDLAPGEDALFRRFDPNQPEQPRPAPASAPAPEYDTDKMPIYSPPSAIPHRAPVKTFEMETVKVDPESDARRATTQRNLRKPKPPSDAAPEGPGRDRKVRAIAVALFGVAVVLVWAIVGVLASKRVGPEPPEPVVTAVPVPVTAPNPKPPEPPAVAAQPATPPDPPAPTPSETAARPEPPAKVAPPPRVAIEAPRPKPSPSPSPKKPTRPAPERAKGAEPPHPTVEF